jgi:hypothetical protein
MIHALRKEVTLLLFYNKKKIDLSFFYVLPCVCAFIFTNNKTRGNGNTAMLSY